RVALRAASPRARGERLPALAVRGGGRADARRARGARDDELLARSGRTARTARTGRGPALARPPLRTGDDPPRLPTLVRRVQGDGPRLLRPSALGGRAAQRDPRRRAGRLPDRPAAARGAVRTGARARRRTRGAALRRRTLTAARARGDRARPVPLVAARDGRARPVHGRRRRSQLRDERPRARRGAVRARVGAA